MGRKRKIRKVSRKKLASAAMTAIYLVIAAIVVFLVIKTGAFFDGNENVVGTSDTLFADVSAADTSIADTSVASGGTSGDTSAASEIVTETANGSTTVWTADTERLEMLVSDFITNLSGKYGVYYIDLDTGKEFGINATDEFIAASTSKLPISMLLYRRIESGEIDPEQILSYIKEDYEYGTGIVQNSSYGTTYTVRETARLAMVYSDNCANNMLIRLLGIEDIREYMESLGGVVYYGARHRTCPKDMALYARELYDFYLDNPDVVGEMIYNLKHTEYNDRINALLPGDVEVAHKIGNYEKTANDVGIVFTEHPYILSVFAADVDFNAACRSISELSRLIYDYLAARS